MDWAEKLALAFMDSLDASDLDLIEGPSTPVKTLATVIRKAKADGMRESGKRLTDLTGKADAVALWDLHCAIKYQANEIEKAPTP